MANRAVLPRKNTMWALVTGNRFEGMDYVTFKVLAWKGAARAALTALALCLVSNGFALNTIIKTKAELLAAEASVSAGDTLTLADGDWDDVEIKISKSGATDRSILLTAQTPGKVVLRNSSHVIFDGNSIVVSGLLMQGASSRSQDAVVFTANSAQCRLTGCAIDAYLRSGVKDNWVTIGGFRNRVDYCSFTGKKNDGITIRLNRIGDKTNEHVISHNYFGPRPPINGNGAEEIQLGLKETQFSDSKTTVEYNLFEECNGELENISVKSGGNIIRGNTFVRCQSHPTLRHGSGSLVEGNYIDGQGASGTGGIRVCGKNHVIVNNFATGLRATDEYGGGVVLHSGDNTDPHQDLANRVPAGNCLVAFNTMAENRQGITYGGGGTAPTGITLANNLVSSTLGTLIVMNANTPFAKLEGNILFGPTSGISARSGIEVVDPKLEKTVLNTYAYYQRGPGSPAMGRAVGNYQISGWTTPPPHIGENAFGLDKPQPLTHNQVGPSWKGGPAVGILDNAFQSPKRGSYPMFKSPGSFGYSRWYDASGRSLRPTSLSAPARRLFLPPIAY
jgi:poly(beta-D-mannuronate) lyase